LSKFKLVDSDRQHIQRNE